MTTIVTAILAGIALVGAIVLQCLGKPIPVELWGVVTLLLGGHLALATPSLGKADPGATGSVG